MNGRVWLVSILAAGCAGHVTAQVFMGLGFYPGDSSSAAAAISADGTAVAVHGPETSQGGWSNGWRWRVGGQQDLVATHVGALAISADGSAIAGSTTTNGAHFPAFRWTQAQGLQDLGMEGGGVPGISGDGQVVVAGGGERWTQQTGPVLLPSPPSGPYGTVIGLATATGANMDGSAIVGGAYISNPGSSIISPYRWTAAGGTQLLPFPGGALLDGDALGVSSDGNTILAAGSQVFRWQAATGMVLVPGLPVGDPDPAMSGDGNTIVSMNKVWNVSTGTQPLTTLLTSAGCNFSGWNNLIVTGVDGDGRAFCGYGTDPAGATEAWYATIPAPGSAAVLGLALCAVGRRRRARPFN